VELPHGSPRTFYEVPVNTWDRVHPSFDANRELPYHSKLLLSLIPGEDDVQRTQSMALRKTYTLARANEKSAEFYSFRIRRNVRRNTAIVANVVRAFASRFSREGTMER